jgi:5'-nucleotidase (lipoprotein e(P4) family)
MKILMLCCWLAAADIDTAVRAEQPEASPLQASNALRWFHASAEMRAVYSEVYGLAEERVAAVAKEYRPGTWAVVMDADETLLDNSEYRLHLARTKAVADWRAWARQQRAVALPGAKEFVHAIRALGGRIVVVTNRSAEVCEPTRANMERVGITVDAVLCAVDGVMDKNPRFAAIRAGNSAAGLPPLHVLAFVGDNIRDFPARSQASPEPWADFGRSLFVLPNPMYGSWEENPE